MQAAHLIMLQKKPDFFVIHLVSSLPLVLLILFNFQTKFILRISGYPHLTFMRRLLWKIAFKKIYAVTCPTELTKEKLLKSNLINKVLKTNLTNLIKIAFYLAVRRL